MQNLKSGYTNLIENHVEKKHQAYEARVTEIIKAKKENRSFTQLSMDDFKDNKSFSTLKWLELIISKNLPLSFCKD